MGVNMDTGMTSKAFSKFGEEFWHQISSQPFGSQTKREIELAIVSAAIRAGFVDKCPAALAVLLNVSITRAHTYLTDLAFREPPIEDRQGAVELIGVLKEAEIVKDDEHLLIPIKDAALRIWLERKVTTLNLNSGGFVRRDSAKLTPAGLAKILSVTEGLTSPSDALKKIPEELRDTAWYKTAKQHWKKGMSWEQALGAIGNSASTIQVLLPPFAAALG